MIIRMLLNMASTVGGCDKHRHKHRHSHVRILSASFSFGFGSFDLIYFIFPPSPYLHLSSSFFGASLSALLIFSSFVFPSFGFAFFRFHFLRLPLVYLRLFCLRLLSSSPFFGFVSFRLHLLPFVFASFAFVSFRLRRLSSSSPPASVSPPSISPPLPPSHRDRSVWTFDLWCDVSFRLRNVCTKRWTQVVLFVSQIKMFQFDRVFSRTPTKWARNTNPSDFFQIIQLIFKKWKWQLQSSLDHGQRIHDRTAAAVCGVGFASWFLTFWSLCLCSTLELCLCLGSLTFSMRLQDELRLRSSVFSFQPSVSFQTSGFSFQHSPWSLGPLAPWPLGTLSFVWSTCWFALKPFTQNEHTQAIRFGWESISIRSHVWASSAWQFCSTIRVSAIIVLAAQTVEISEHAAASIHHRWYYPFANLQLALSSIFRMVADSHICDRTSVVGMTKLFYTYTSRVSGNNREGNSNIFFQKMLTEFAILVMEI